MRHRRSAERTGRWIAAASALLLVLSAVLLVSVLREPAPAPTDAGGAVVQPRGERGRVVVRSRGERGRVVVQSRREGARAWRTVLAELDRRRAAAYAAADPRLLRRVYLRRSPELGADRALLLRYRRHGLRVLAMRMWLLDVQVRAQRRDRVVLVVRERLARARVRGPGAVRHLPADDVDRRVLTLQRVSGGGWRVAAVRPA